jgi:hypothetical protein
MGHVQHEICIEKHNEIDESISKNYIILLKFAHKQRSYYTLNYKKVFKYCLNITAWY